MNRTLTYHITEDNAGLRIEQYLRRRGYSRQNLTDLKKMRESVLLKRRLVISYPDDFFRRFSDHPDSGDKSLRQIPPSPFPLDILYEDEDILVVNKPAGMPIHPSINNYYNSLANACAYYYQQQNKPFIFRCTNRLDRDTSGVTVIAKHMVSSNILSSYAYKHLIDREYLAIVRGNVIPSSGTIDAPLSRKSGSVIERIVDFEHGERAVTHYQVVEEKNGHSLVSLHLETGRTHQIRIHMKYLGFPLIGDYLYNPDMESIHRQALHSHTLRFAHPITEEQMEFTAPLPEDMKRILL